MIKIPIMKYLLSCLLIFTFVHKSTSQVITIPTDYSSIQAGINAAIDGDTIVVLPGNYLENIYLQSKEITVGSMYLLNKDTSYITQTVIDGNLNGSVITIFNCSTSEICGFTIVNGKPQSQGGGINCWLSNPVITNMKIINNEAEYGGGIFIEESSPYIQDVRICDNSSNNGGGIYCSYSGNPTLVNVVVENNQSSLQGGGISCEQGSNPIIKNTLIVNNQSTVGGGVFCYNNSNPIFINSTLSNNAAINQGDGGAIACFKNCDIVIINSIVWDNIPEQIYLFNNSQICTVTVSYSDIQDGESGIVSNNGGVYWLEGNLDTDPLFSLTNPYYFSLTNNSPCVDMGNPDTLGLNLPTTDIIGNNRLWDGNNDGSAIIDIGAYEFDSIQVSIEEDVKYASEEICLNYYPNPFIDIINFEYLLCSDSDIEILIIDNKGKIIRCVNETNKPIGLHKMSLDLSSLKLGLYYFSVITDTEVISGKLIKRY